MSDAIIAIERLYAIGDVDAQRRNAQDCADGALIGPLTRDMVVKVLNAKQGLSDDIVHGRLDAWHAIVKVEHSDRLEEDPSSGLVTRYYKLTRQLRRVSAYGQGQKTFKAVASEHKEKWKRPVAPQVDGTRTKLYKTVRAPPNFFYNYRAAFLGLCVLTDVHTRQGEAKEATKLRAIGKALTDMMLLLFVACRYDFRRPIRNFSQVPQSVSVSGLDKNQGRVFVFRASACLH